MTFPRSSLPPVMCLTLDGHALDPVAQTRALCAAGAQWIQLRMKHATPAIWLATAREVVALCRAHDVLITLNDSVDLVLATDADGVHLGARDEAWDSARARLGPHKLVGGTVNHADDARRAASARALDYVGIGPYRFTATKQNLAPLLGLSGIVALHPLLDGLPAWAIGGLQPADLPGLRAAGLAGAAVSSPLFQADTPATHAAYLAAWAHKNHESQITNHK